MTSLEIAIKALEEIAKASRDEGGCYWTNRQNISIANKALIAIKEKAKNSPKIANEDDIMDAGNKRHTFDIDGE